MRIAGAPLGRLDRTLGSGRIVPGVRSEVHNPRPPWGIRLPLAEAIPAALARLTKGEADRLRARRQCRNRGKLLFSKRA
jgi:hypothetical protein